MTLCHIMAIPNETGHNCNIKGDEFDKTTEVDQVSDYE